MRRLQILVPLCLLALVTGSIAVAQKGPGFSLQMVIASAGPTNTQALQYRTTAGTDIPACLPFDSIPIWHAIGGRVVLAYSMDSTLDFSAAMNTLQGRWLVDAVTRTGPSVGLRLEDGERSHSTRGKVDYNQIWGAPGARGGLCTIALETPTGSDRRFPCDALADCSGISAGTCQSSASLATEFGDANQYRRSQGCAFVLAQTDTAGTRLSGNP